MNKKALVIASMGSMLDNFNKPNIRLLKELGYDVTIAANFNCEDSNSKEKNDEFCRMMQEEGINIQHIDFSRKLFNISKQISSIKQTKKLLKQGFDLIHCHSPICAAITRIVANKYRKKGTKIIYTAHGFHFYKGAPIKNWLIYYPIEKFCSRFTDILITINHEDYNLAQKKMKAKKNEYVQGVGIDIEKLNKSQVNKNDKKRDLGIPMDSIIILSVGELSRRKNHETLIKAVDMLKNTKIHCLIAGRGDLEDYLKSKAKENCTAEQVHFLGFRTDVAELYKIADFYVHPAFQEGLSVAVMEAMASGLPCVLSDIRGNRDLIENGEGGFLCNPLLPQEFATSINKLIHGDDLCAKMSKRNIVCAKNLDIKQSNKRMLEIYTSNI